MKTLTIEQIENLKGGKKWNWETTICSVAGLGIGTAIGTFFWPFGLFAGAVFVTVCQVGDTYGWDN